jgi:hypothetical protein
VTTDIYTKSDEFHAWMIGERMMNPETTTKAKEKELFKQFMEVSKQLLLPISLARADTLPPFCAGFQYGCACHPGGI